MTADLRARIQAQRRALGKDEVSKLSYEVTDRFLDGCGLRPDFWNGKLVALYRSLPYELDMRGLEEKLTAFGARLCFPRVLDSATHEMEFASPSVGSGLDPSEWSLGAHGIEVPPPHFNAVNSLNLKVIFIPGVAFGLQGERLGMGAGYYDRYLPGAPQALKIALAFDFQLLPALDQQPWDQKMDWIWTEKRHVQLPASAPG